MPNPSRNDIYEAVIRRMVTEALQAQEDRFVLEHGNDTDEQLACYLRECALQLGHSPWPREIVGGDMICKRFGSWDCALRKAELPDPITANKPSQFLRYRNEIEQQKLIYRQKKAMKKARAQQRMKEQRAKQKTGKTE